MTEDAASISRLRRVSGVFVFLALSGLVPFLARYGVFSQWILLLHILVGIAAVVPLTWIFWKHGREANRAHPTQWWSPGLWSGLGWLVLCASGLWLVGKGIWGVFVPYRMHYFHLVAGIALGAVGLFHIIYGLAKSQFPRARYATLLRPVILWVIVFAVGAIVIGLSRREGPLAKGNFSPSNARTTTGNVIPAKLLIGSASCGSSGCHSAIYEEWAPGAHHYSASDPFYQTIKANYIRDRGPDSPRYCAGCHEPVPLAAGESIVARTESDGAEGSSCVFCHALRDTETRGNANYAIRAPDPYLFESSGNPELLRISDMLIRLHPDQHKLDYSVEPSKTAEFCGTCHKQYINKEENGWGFVQLQDQYDDWKNGPWHTDPHKNLQCQDCHMPEVSAEDPSRNARGFIHDHRILASNNYVPKMLNLPGAEKQIALVNEWLAGETVISDIAKVWPSGPIVPVNLEPEGPLVPGRAASIRALVTNLKVGHQFPTGPLDVIEVWLEFQATDGRGKAVYSAGTLGPDGNIQGKTVEYRSYLLDKNAQPVFTHALWNVVGARDKRALMPGGSDTTEFSFPIPRNTVGPLRCSVRLLYRKFNYQTQSQLFPKGNGPQIPIVEISKSTIEVPLESSKGPSRVAASAGGARSGPSSR
jgi:Cytochrome c554 and c-prime